jgi:putative transcriptional regulator
MKFRHGFLIATSIHREHPYNQSVIYVCEHSPHGSFGLLLNKHIDLSLAELTKKYSPGSAATPLYLGGCTQSQERGFVLHRNLGQYWEGTTQLADDLFLTTTNDILDDIFRFYAQDYRIMLGYTGWHAGQLDEEYTKDYWFFLPYNSSLIFSKAETLWQDCYTALGFNPEQHIYVDPGFNVIH